MKHILAIETSCDETACAVLGEDLSVLGSVVLSQDKIHAPYGGVVPELASREHLLSLPYVVEETLLRSGLALKDIDFYGVTQGPGLVGSLLVGISFAKGLAFYYQKPLIPVDHIEAHIESAFLGNREIRFPLLALVVSGGHTSLFLMREELDYELIGSTRDDAAGEAFDKIAKFLGIGYPGGPIIDRLARQGDPTRFTFALPRMSNRSFDFSFSGLKTEALKKIREFKIRKGSQAFYDFLASFEQGVIRALLSNLSRAVKEYRPASLILCGGVARNRKLREFFVGFSKRHNLAAYIPEAELCTDNAIMVAALALKRLKVEGVSGFPFDLDAYPRAPYYFKGTTSRK